MGDNAEKRHQPVSPDQDIWNQQWSVEQAAEEFIYFDAYRGDFMQNSGLPREEKEEAGTVKILCGKIWCITDCGNAAVCDIVSRIRL